MNKKKLFNDCTSRAKKILKDKKETGKFIDEVMDKLNGMDKFAGIAEQMRLVGDMVVDYVKGKYRRIPWGTILSIVAAFVYFLFPADVIPDVLVGVGFIDDLSVIALMLKSIQGEIDKYAIWRSANREEEAEC